MPYKDLEKRRQYHRDYYKNADRKAVIVSKNRERRAILREKVRQIKLSLGCKRCGFNECSEALDFHHRNPEEKLFNIGTGCLASISWQRIQNEIDKCDVLCANCHRQERCKCCA